MKQPRSGLPRRRTSSTHPHSLESRVMRELLASSELQLTDLVVRRITRGVRLEGILHIHHEDSCVTPSYVDKIARRITGVKVVENNLVVCIDANCGDNGKCEPFTTTF